MSQDIAALRATYEAAEQGHVFTYWDKLSDAERVTCLLYTSDAADE